MAGPAATATGAATSATVAAGRGDADGGAGRRGLTAGGQDVAKSFDRARAYYLLLTVNAEVVVAKAEEKPTKYSP